MSEKCVELLVFDGCPNVDATLERVHAAIREANVGASVRVVLVASDEQAQRLRFLGSPTVRVGGADVDPSAEDRVHFGLQCRVYSVRGRLDGAPPVDWIVSALRGERVAEEIAAPGDSERSCR